MPPAATAPLPQYWEEKKDPRGRTFYSNAKTETTTWQRPVPPESPFADDDPPPQYKPPTPVKKEPSPWSSCMCSPSRTFWVVAMMGWAVWILAVVASADNHWFRDADAFSAGNEVLLDRCNDGILDEELCAYYITFTCFQFSAVFAASISMVLLMIALFRPAAGKCLSAYSLAIAVGTLTALYSLFQMLAFVFVIIIQQTENNSGGMTDNLKLGITFGLAAAGVSLGMLQAGVVLVFARAAGDGPFYKCLHNCFRKHERSRPVSGAPLPQPPRPVASAPVREAGSSSQVTVASQYVENPIPRPGFEVELGTQYVPSPKYVQSPVAGSAVQPVVRSHAVHSPGVSPAVQREVLINSPIVQRTVAKQAVPSVATSPVVKLAVESPAAQAPVPSPDVEAASAVGEIAPSPVVSSPTVQSAAVSSPSVKSKVVSQSVESPAASLTVQSAEASPAVLSEMASSDEESPEILSEVESPGVVPSAPSPSVTSSVASPAAQSAAESSVV